MIFSSPAETQFRNEDILLYGLVGFWGINDVMVSDWHPDGNSQKITQDGASVYLPYFHHHKNTMNIWESWYESYLSDQYDVSDVVPKMTVVSVSREQQKHSVKVGGASTFHSE